MEPTLSKIYYITNADTELLAMRSVWESLPDGFPELLVRRMSEFTPGLSGPIDRDTVVILRLLGGRGGDPEVDAIANWTKLSGAKLLAFPGEAGFDDQLAEMSDVPGGTYKTAFTYLVQGGLANIENLLLFVADTLLGYGFGFKEPALVPPSGVFLSLRCGIEQAPKAVIVFYRAHLISSNTSFIRDLAESIGATGMDVDAYFCYSLRSNSDLSGASPADEIRGLSPDVVVTTVLSAGGYDDDEVSWNAGELAELGVPILQGIASTSSRETWSTSDFGLSPMDAAMTVAIPEFDGRIISVPFSFKETIDDDTGFGTSITAYRSNPSGLAAVASQVERLSRLRHLKNSEKRIAVVLSAYPTRRSRLGNAVGLDTPQSAVLLLDRLKAEGYAVDGYPSDPTELMEMLGDLIDYESESVSSGADHGISWSTQKYSAVFSSFPELVKDEVERAWGACPGSAYVQDDLFRFPAISFGNVVVAIQPPRGYGENPIAIYHSAELAPTHHYLAFYRWLDLEFGANAIIHLGKHGTLEWLPGKSLGLSESCYPEVALGGVPFVYPFIVNDPGEGTQAKRRSHAVIIDHMVPPLTRAGSYGSIVQLEDLLDEHQRVSALDPSKLPMLRKEIWALMEENRITQDLGLDGSVARFEEPEFDALVSEIDGYLCELKDAVIRGGLHVLGSAPDGDLLVETVVAITRADQIRAVSLRGAVARWMGIDLDSEMDRVDLVDAQVTTIVAQLADSNWDVDQIPSSFGEEVETTLKWVCTELVPAILGSDAEMTSVLAAISGRFIEPGPSGAPSRGMAHVLPTGRNFYSIDPRGVPSRFAWRVGQQLADGLIERFRQDTGTFPRSVGLVIWGTSAMRTGGDDIAQVLALLGVKPDWDGESSRVTGLHAIPLAELGRPRVDVTCRISGFFRDAFPQAVRLLDEAFELVAGLDELGQANPLVGTAGTPRIFGPPPRAYGSGILPLLISQNWRGDEDLAEVYLNWSGFSYGRSHYGLPAREQLSARLFEMEVAVKNQDNREHDIFDSDDYLQEHGGMIAAGRVLKGQSPLSYFGDSSNVEHPKVRSLAEEAARVFRSRVVNPKWIGAMMRHGYKGAFEMAATADYLFGYQATAGVIKDWMFDEMTTAYVSDPNVSEFFRLNNPDALASICERLLEAAGRGLWTPRPESVDTLRRALLAARGWSE